MVPNFRNQYQLLWKHREGHQTVLGGQRRLPENRTSELSLERMRDPLVRRSRGRGLQAEM